MFARSQVKWPCEHYCLKKKMFETGITKTTNTNLLYSINTKYHNLFLVSVQHEFYHALE